MLLDKALRQQASVVVVVLKLTGEVSTLLQDSNQLLRYTPRIMHPAVHSHTAQGVVHVASIPNHHSTPAVILLGHPLVDRIHPGMLDGIGCILAPKVLQPFLDMFRGQYLLNALGRRCWKQHPPTFIRLQYHTPLVWIRNVIHIAQIVKDVFESELSAHNQEAFIVCESTERDVEQLSHSAACSICTDYEACFDALNPHCSLNVCCHPAVMLLQPIQPGSHSNVNQIREIPIQLLVASKNHLPLLQLKSEGKLRLISDATHIELGDFPGPPVSVLVPVDPQSLCNALLYYSDHLHHLQGWWMEG
mmetsp:Transcript_36784/g.88466  ORF Transcript_36784/g.88466 Transcript_36784/m.88466 type:complete len:304 (-) Transcript_36784:254-1165(-)